jgi:hypothetical protein
LVRFIWIFMTHIPRWLACGFGSSVNEQSLSVGTAAPTLHGRIH